MFPTVEYVHKGPYSQRIDIVISIWNLNDCLFRVRVRVSLVFNKKTPDNLIMSDRLQRLNGTTSFNYESGSI